MERPIGGYDNINGIGGNRAGILYAGNPFGAGYVIPKGRASGQPVMPGENPADINNVYGRPGPQPRLPMAFVPEENTFLAQAYPGGQNIGNVGGMLGEVPGDMTKFTSLLESIQEQNMQNSQGEKDRRSLVNYGRNLGNY